MRPYEGRLHTVRDLLEIGPRCRHALYDARFVAHRFRGFSPCASVGSSCNECDEQNSDSATMLRVKPDGLGREVFATGLSWASPSGALRLG